MAQPIIPFACPLILCDRIIARDNRKIDFLGAFTRIEPLTDPHTHRRMTVIAHLTGGRGIVNTSVEIRYAASEELVAVTQPHEINIPDRDVLVRLVQSIDEVRFERPGVYLVQLLCEHMCIADTRLLLREPVIPQAGGTDD